MSAKKQFLILCLFALFLMWLLWKSVSADALLECVVWTLIACILIASILLYGFTKDDEFLGFFKPSPWKLVISCVGIGFVIYSWIPDYDALQAPSYRPPSRESLYPISGKLVIYDKYYGIDIGNKIIAIECAITKRKYIRGELGRARQACFPENTQDYLGKEVKAYLSNPVDNTEYLYEIYELKSGYNIIVDYGKITSMQVEGFKITRETVLEDAMERGGLASLLILPPLFMWISGMAWNSWRRKRGKLQCAGNSGTARGHEGQ